MPLNDLKYTVSDARTFLTNHIKLLLSHVKMMNKDDATSDIENNGLEHHFREYMMKKSGNVTPLKPIEEEEDEQPKRSHKKQTFKHKSEIPEVANNPFMPEYVSEEILTMSKPKRK